MANVQAGGQDAQSRRQVVWLHGEIKTKAIPPSVRLSATYHEPRTNAENGKTFRDSRVAAL